MSALTTFSTHHTTGSIWPCAIHESSSDASLRDIWLKYVPSKSEFESARSCAGAGRASSSDHLVHSTRGSHTHSSPVLCVTAVGPGHTDENLCDYL